MAPDGGSRFPYVRVGLLGTLGTGETALGAVLVAENADYFAMSTWVFTAACLIGTALALVCLTSAFCLMARHPSAQRFAVAGGALSAVFYVVAYFTQPELV